jgi:hypothetical protein
VPHEYTPLATIYQAGFKIAARKRPVNHSDTGYGPALERIKNFIGKRVKPSVH